ncbi:hypothetical protein V6N11_002591 [Hibiscus sabdariffa]|uniref:CCHC-type domain-containing protein n=1 Tax=Hibiscus sabdariffa TaxID=183260 RepID=A0ABR2SAP4_9ROSI
MEYALVLKLLGRRVGYSTLYNRLLNLWKPEKPIRLTDIENDCYIVKFSSQRDYIAALTDGPWTVFGHYITVEPWSPDFDPSQAYPKRILAWIRLPGLPITWYKRSLHEAIGSCVGSVVKIDFQTDNGHRGRFARMAVKINLNQPLVSKIVVNGRTQLVEYESLPVVCFHCGTYGHIHDQCPRRLQPEDPPSTTVLPPIPPSTQLPTEPFGPWMLVEKKRNRTTRTNRTSSRPNDVPLVTHSRFNPLFSGNDHAHIPDTHVAVDSIEAPAEHIEPTGDITAPTVVPVIQNPVATLTSENDLATVSAGKKSKAKSKVTGVMRKHNQNVLGSRNLNIIPLKNSVGVNFYSSKISKGRHSQPFLNPEKHTTLTLDPVAPPTSVVRQVQQSPSMNAGSVSVNADMVYADSMTSGSGAIHSGRSAMME